MARGARSIRGSLGAYLLASLGLVAVLALVLWLGWRGPAPAGGCRVTLAADGALTAATLDDGSRLQELSPGESRSVPPGAYRVVLFAADGSTREGRLELVAGERTLDGTTTLSRP